MTFLLRAVVPAFLLTSVAVGTQDSRHLVMISVDGLMPSTYLGAEAARTPALKALRDEGAYAEGVIGVLPSVTYPSHTTLITGVPPALHGIFGNAIFDAEGRSNSAWYWYARDIRVPTLIGAARARGMRAAAVSWPVTVGMEADYLVPEFWRTRSSHPSDFSLMRALSTPGLFDRLESARKSPLPWPFTDKGRTEIASYIMTTHKPDVLLLHLTSLDSAQHGGGPGSARAQGALQQIDGYIRELRDAVARAGLADRTHFAVVSDHGFAPIERQLQPNAVFRKEGLLRVDEAGTVTEWQAYFHAEGGSGFVRLKDPADRATAERVRTLLDDLKADARNGIASVWSREDLDRLGAEPNAAFGIGMLSGFYTGSGHDAVLVPTRNRGGHGFDPSMPAVHASFILAGPGARGRGSVGVVRMTQIAPTLADLLGVSLSAQADEPFRLTRASVGR
jgi:predicted AlkP superfamily pyrophosphatase or phosphodiesterase